MINIESVRSLPQANNRVVADGIEILYSYGEQRFVTFGLLQGRVVAVVHTDRDELTRIISARKATKYEQRIYFEQLSD